MAPQNEGNKKPRNGEIENEVEQDGSVSSGGVVLESEDIEPEHFSNEDPFRTPRIAEITESETR